MLLELITILTSLMLMLMVGLYGTPKEDPEKKAFKDFMKCLFTKIWWTNFFNQFLIFLKIKQKLAFPFDMKKYIAKNASIKLQIKLFQCSKQFQQIIKRHRGRQCGILYLDSEIPFYMRVDETNITMGINWRNKILTEKSPIAVKEMFYIDDAIGLSDTDLEELYSKLDLTELKRIVFYDFTLNSNTMKKYLVPSLVEIDLHEVIIDQGDIVLAILEQCPLTTKIRVNWQNNLSSMTKLAAVKRRTKIEEFALQDISDSICIQDIINFINNQMDTEYYFELSAPISMNRNIPSIPWEKMMEILKQNLSNCSVICVNCKVTK